MCVHIQNFLTKSKKRWRIRTPVGSPPKSRFDPVIWAETLEASGVFRTHPSEAAYVMRNLNEGFDIMTETPVKDLDNNRGNLPTTQTQKQFLVQYLNTSLEKGHCIGPFTDETQAAKQTGGKLHISLLGVVNTSGKNRAIVHLSAPRSGASVNSELAEKWCTVSYVLFVAICRLFNTLGQGAYIWVVDVESAYLQLQTAKKCWRFLGVKFLGAIFVFVVLMLGLASAPAIYTLFADVVLFTLVGLNPKDFYLDGLRLVEHYLDDFFGGHSNYSVACKQFIHFIKLLRKLNIPYGDHKAKWPATRQRILGFIHDTVFMGFFLPEDKKEKYLRQLRGIKKKRSATKQQIQQMVGRLRHTANAVFGGQAFVARLEDAAYTKHMKGANSRTGISLEIVEDLEMWEHILEKLA